MTDKKFNDAYSQWTYDNYTSCGKTPPGWVPAEPTNLTFNESPWEGELTYNNVGKMIQYRKGVWELI